MGREVRKVPPNWKHPKDERGRDRPMHDENFADCFAQWLADFDRIRRGELDEVELECYADVARHPEGALAAWLNDAGQPHDPEVYRPWKDDEATWFQVWETVTEGTPVTPPFATKAELVNYLVDYGESYGTRYVKKFSRASAQAFVDEEWAPSMVLMIGNDGETKVEAMGIEIPHALGKL